MISKELGPLYFLAHEGDSCSKNMCLECPLFLSFISLVCPGCIHASVLTTRLHLCSYFLVLLTRTSKNKPGKARASEEDRERKEGDILFLRREAGDKLSTRIPVYEYLLTDLFASFLGCFWCFTCVKYVSKNIFGQGCLPQHLCLLDFLFLTLNKFPSLSVPQFPQL